MRDDKDRSGKWLIEHHGNALLLLGGIGPIHSWKPLQAEVVQPRQLPDGLIEATLEGESVSDLFLVESYTYPDQRILEQVTRDAMLVYLDRRILPEVLTLILHPLGAYRVETSHDLASRHRGWTTSQTNWKVVELWKLEANDLLAAGDVGLIPWVPLTHFDGPPEPILQECRKRIDKQAAGEERGNLLAVSQILGRLRYDRALLMAIFGGSETMIESPFLKELMEESEQKGIHQTILDVLEGRLGPVPNDIVHGLESVRDRQKLTDLAKWAGQCPDYDSFRSRLGV